MATRGRTRQDRSSLGLERLELEDGQGQGGGQELDSKGGRTRLTAWTFISLFLWTFSCETFHFGMETTWQESLCQHLVISELEKDQS